MEISKLEMCNREWGGGCKSSLSRIQREAPQPNSDDVAFQMGIKRGFWSPPRFSPPGWRYTTETYATGQQSPKGQLGGRGGGGGGGLVQKREHNKKWPLRAEAKVDRG